MAGEDSPDSRDVVQLFFALLCGSKSTFPSSNPLEPVDDGAAVSVDGSYALRVAKPFVKRSGQRTEFVRLVSEEMADIQKIAISADELAFAFDAAMQKIGVEGKIWPLGDVIIIDAETIAALRKAADITHPDNLTCTRQIAENARQFRTQFVRALGLQIDGPT